MKLTRSIIALTAFGLIAGDAVAQEEQVCKLHQLMSVTQQLRRASLSLRGHVPSIDEYLGVDGQEAVPDEMIDAFIASDAFRLQMRRFHEQVLWPNPAGSSLFDPTNSLFEGTFADQTKFLYIGNQATRQMYRGGNSTHTCQNVLQSTLGYRPDGLPVCEHQGYDTVNTPNGPVQRAYCEEGFVWVKPYWHDPGDPLVKVCAYDAQLNSEWTSIDEDADMSGSLEELEDLDHNGQNQIGQLARCDYMSVNGYSRLGCGCGPDLQWCSDFTLPDHLWRQWREQVLRLVDDYTDGSHPYSEMLTTKRTYVNGPLVHYKKYLAQQPGLGVTYNVRWDGDAPVDGPEVAGLGWHDADTWVELTRGGIHSGILTLPGYTLRFQTNRGRANRFRIGFMDQYFVPPSVYEQDDCDPTSYDLSERCVCRSCHQVLEPLSAYFGQIAERGSGLLTQFTKTCTTSDCVKETSEGRIEGLLSRFYVTDYSNGQEFIIAPLAYAKDHPEHEVHYDEGPAGLVGEALVEIEGETHSLFARATVKNLFRFFMKREMNLDPQAADNELDLLDELATELTTTDDFTVLARRLVKLDTFRRLP